jgi:hypothetical protein
MISTKSALRLCAKEQVQVEPSNAIKGLGLVLNSVWNNVDSMFVHFVGERRTRLQSKEAICSRQT